MESEHVIHSVMLDSLQHKEFQADSIPEPPGKTLGDRHISK